MFQKKQQKTAQKTPVWKILQVNMLDGNRCFLLETLWSGIKGASLEGSSVYKHRWGSPLCDQLGEQIVS